MCEKEEHWLAADFFKLKSDGPFYCPNCAEIKRKKKYSENELEISTPEQRERSVYKK